MHRSVVEPMPACTSNEVDINVTECNGIRGNGLPKGEGEGETESSSSFGDSDSGIENPASDSEVGSHFCGDSPSNLAINGFGDFSRMRKKKLTSHWRTFIRPLMWRCKWVELQIKKCNAQALKYERELAGYCPKKHFQSENFSKEGSCAKFHPFASDIPRDKIMLRRKRRKIEDTTDIVPYMSNHNLFSYEGKDNRTADGTRADEYLGIQGKANVDHEADNEKLWLQLWDGDDLLEGKIRKIEMLQSKVNNLKIRMNKVTNENAGKLSMADNLGLLVPSNGLSSSSRSLASPPTTSGDRMPVRSTDFASQLLAQYNMGNVVKPEMAVSSNDDMSHLAALVENSDQTNIQGAFINVEDEILMYNDKSKEEISNFDEGIIQPSGNHQLAKDSTEGTLPAVFVEPDLPTGDQPPPKMRSIAKLTSPKRRNRRAKRKARSSKWSKRSSG